MEIDILLIAVTLIGVFLFYRNYWVFRVRTKLLEEEFHSYHRLPSYDKMFWCFWIWDVKRFYQ